MRSFALPLLLVLLATPALGEDLFDPTRPPLYVQGEADFENADFASLVLSAIVNAEDRQFAVINGRRMRVGEEIAGTTLTEIQPWGVLLDHADGETLELRLSRKAAVPAAPAPEAP